MTVTQLVVNADDFGRSAGVNAGVLRAHDQGIVTSASLMVRWPAAVDAVAQARSRPGLGLGLHLDLGEWAYAAGEWKAVYTVCGESAAEIEREVAAQLDRFRELVGMEPAHLDSHQHVHLHEPARSVVARAADALGVPLRQLTPGIVHHGEFYGQTATGEPYPEGIAPARLVEVVRDLAAGVVTEIACHPGLPDPEPWSVYDRERERELEALCDRTVAEAIAAEHVALTSFAALSRAPHRAGSRARAR